MNETLFYVLGTGLAVLAFITSFVGLRSSRFPGSNAAGVAVAAAFVFLVLGATTFAVRQAKDEKRHREEAGLSQATEEAEAQEAEAQEATR